MVKHVVQTHFGLSEAARTKDDEEGGEERVVMAEYEEDGDC